jgi:hypothetical protein
LVRDEQLCSDDLDARFISHQHGSGRRRRQRLVSLFARRAIGWTRSGPLLFAASKRDAIRTFFEGSCHPAALTTIGTTIGDLFDPTFATAVPLNAALGLDCLGGGQCHKWIDGYRADRPHIFPARTGPGGSWRRRRLDPVVGARAEFVNRWIAWRTLGGVDPGACGPGVEALHDAMGGAAVCSMPPPNN